MSEINERRLRLYKFLLSIGRVTIESIPEPYKTSIENEGEVTE